MNNQRELQENPKLTRPKMKGITCKMKPSNGTVKLCLIFTFALLIIAMKDTVQTAPGSDEYQPTNSTPVGKPHESLATLKTSHLNVATSEDVINSTAKVRASQVAQQEPVINGYAPGAAEGNKWKKPQRALAHKVAGEGRELIDAPPVAVTHPAADGSQSEKLVADRGSPMAGNAEGVDREGPKAQAVPMKLIRSYRAADYGDSTPKPATTTERSSNGSKVDETKLKCRIEKDLYLDFAQYKHYSCANCYSLVPETMFWDKLFFVREERIWLLNASDSTRLLPNETEIIKYTFKEDWAFTKWQECCSEAADCCIKNSKYLPEASGPDGSLRDSQNRDVCPATWDGLSCWPDSPAGIVAQQQCPESVYFLGFVPVCRGVVTKQCFPNGSWFLRKDHEWSNFTNCKPKPIYATRLVIGALWQLVSVIVMAPAIYVMNKFPSRASGNRRLKILTRLLIWLLVNALMASIHKMAVVKGIFLADNENDHPPRRYVPTALLKNLSSTSPVQSDAQITPSQEAQLTTPSPVSRQSRSTSGFSTQLLLNTHQDRLERAMLKYEKPENRCSSSDITDCGDRNLIASDDRGLHIVNNAQGIGADNTSWSQSDDDESKSSLDLETDRAIGSLEAHTTTDYTVIDHSSKSSIDNRSPSGVECSSQPADVLYHADVIRASDEEPPETLCGYVRRKRNSSEPGRSRQSTLIIFICWILSLGMRITRLLGYAWMFTGAVYLCSVLHFAPAEPPALFIKVLLFATNAIPLAMSLIYITARAIYEPSPLTLILKLPYYYLNNDTVVIKELWQTELHCWISRSEYDEIEDIIDLPNLVLVIMNFVLFVLTLIFMCRMSRPGSTRHEMTVSDYFRAAGTLVVLYGAHYALFAYQPPVEGCITGQIMYYASLFVDGLQGIAVSYVFCYRTPEGKEVMSKMWANWQDRSPEWCRLSHSSRYHITRVNGINSESNNSSTNGGQSRHSICIGKDLMTELVDLDENPTGSHF